MRNAASYMGQIREEVSRRMGRQTIEVGWDYEVPLDEVEVFRSERARELECYYGVDAESLTDLEVARYMVRSSHPSTRYLKNEQHDLVFHD